MQSVYLSQKLCRCFIFCNYSTGCVIGPRGTDICSTFDEVYIISTNELMHASNNVLNFILKAAVQCRPFVLKQTVP